VAPEKNEHENLNNNEQFVEFCPNLATLEMKKLKDHQISCYDFVKTLAREFQLKIKGFHASGVRNSSNNYLLIILVTSVTVLPYLRTFCMIFYVILHFTVTRDAIRTFYRLFEEKVGIGLPFMEEFSMGSQLSLRFGVL